MAGAPKQERRRPLRFDKAGFLLGVFCVGMVAVMSELDSGRGGSVNDRVFDQYQQWKPRSRSILLNRPYPPAMSRYVPYEPKS